MRALAVDCQRPRSRTCSIEPLVRISCVAPPRRRLYGLNSNLVNPRHRTEESNRHRKSRAFVRRTRSPGQRPVDASSNKATVKGSVHDTVSFAHFLRDVFVEGRFKTHAVPSRATSICPAVSDIASPVRKRQWKAARRTAAASMRPASASAAARAAATSAGSGVALRGGSWRTHAPSHLHIVGRCRRVCGIASCIPAANSRPRCCGQPSS